ncbi:MAG TPA: hypothetical protein VMT20_25120 [Terriglobia bacterium]|nr:hypothetical protein [Terriglobia bacterium]
MQPHDAQVLLYKIYNSAYQFGNAGTSLHPETWNISSRKRALFYQQANSLRTTVDALQKPWNGFYKNPGDAELGRETLGGLNKLLPEADSFAKALADAAGTSVAADYQKSAADLADLERQLEAYVNGLEAKGTASAKVEAKVQASPPPKPEPSETAKAGVSPAAASAPPSPSPSESIPSRVAPMAAPASASAASSGTSVPKASAQPAPAPVAMTASEVQALLYKIYAAGYRVADLTGSLPLDKWKLSDQERAALTEKSDSLRAALQAEEKPRSEFYSHPEDRGLGSATVSALQSLSMRLDDFQTALEASPGASTASDYRQSSAELAKLTQQLEPYVAYLEAKASAGEGALETEVVRTAGTSPPLTSTSSAEQPPLSTGQVKAVLNQAYEPAFRLRDLLSQEHPNAWKASDAQRNAFNDASHVLAQRLDELDKWRTQFEAHPDSLEAAFEVYASLGKLTEPAHTVGHLVGQYENPTLGNEYLNRAQQVENFRDQVEPYLSYLLSAFDHQTGTVERNFRACETELSYAMRPSQAPATPMRNVNPVFQGHPTNHHVNHTEHSSSAHAHASKAHETKKSAKPTSEKPKP